MSLTAAEQYFVELQNRARLDPLAEAARLGIDLNQGLATGTLTGESRPVLAANDLLSAAASGHSEWMLAADVFSHTGSGGSTPGNRMETAGYAFNGAWTWGENISWTGTTGTINLNAAIAGQHASLFRSAGHRQNTLNSNFSEIGVGQVAGQFLQHGTNWNASMLTEVFARSGNSVLVTGVAYTDTNGDAFYSIGEGRGGVAFQIVGGNSVVNGTAGGYAVATFAHAETAVRILHGAHTSDLRLNTTAGNAKLDLVGDAMVAVSSNVTLVSGAVTAVHLLGVSGLSATGNDAANHLVGNSGANLLRGGGQSDTLDGGNGGDNLYGDAGVDFLYGRTGNDYLSGGTEADNLWGGAGSDQHIGGDGAGVDYARYDDANHGNLTIRLDNAALNAGAAAVGDTYSGIEGLVGGAGNDVIVGNGANNHLFGSGGNDLVYGGGGNDLVYGGGGNDELSGDAGADHLWGGAGADAHYGGTDASIDYARYDDANHGNLAIRLDNAALNVGAAAVGDTYSGIEGLVGGAGNDVVIGNASANWLFGQSAADFIDGLGGNDYLNGGAGADRFRMSTALGAGNVDTVADFTHLVDDILLLSSIFSAIGATLTADEFRVGAAVDANDFILYNATTGALTYDSNGNVAGGATQFATLTAGLGLTVDDFIMV